MEKRLEAITCTLERTGQTQRKTEEILKMLAKEQAKTERVVRRLDSLVSDHEERLKHLEGD
jgi:hypothetical protein